MRSSLFTRAFSHPVIPVTTGRFNPLHIGHMESVLRPMLEEAHLSRRASIRTEEFPPIVLVMGSSGEDRDILKNPFSFEQRVAMLKIAAQQLSDLAPGGVTLTDSCFLRYADSSAKHTPPSLDRLANAIEEHCHKYGIPMRSLASYVCIKPGEMGREYQVRGGIYKNMHQMTAVAQALGYQFHEAFVPEDTHPISATQIREDLCKHFTLLSPEIFSYVQEQLARAMLNARAIGDSPHDDKVVDVRIFCERLFSQGKMLAFSKEGVKISSVDSKDLDTFKAYTTHRTQYQEADVSSALEQQVLCR